MRVRTFLMIALAAGVDLGLAGYGRAIADDKTAIYRCSDFTALRDGQTLPADYYSGAPGDTFYVGNPAERQIKVGNPSGPPDHTGVVTDPSLVFSPVRARIRFSEVELFYIAPHSEKGVAVTTGISGDIAKLKLPTSPHDSILHATFPPSHPVGGVTGLRVTGPGVIVTKVCFIARI